MKIIYTQKWFYEIQEYKCDIFSVYNQTDVYVILHRPNRWGKKSIRVK